MGPSREQLRNRFVTVQLSLLSIAVALILENLLGMLLDRDHLGLIVGLQAADVTVSALSMWVGFAYAISSLNKPPHLLDFLVPFILLFSLSSAVYFINTGQLAYFFFAGAVGSAGAAATLWLDVRQARRFGSNGPTPTAWLLTLICGLEVLFGIVFLLDDRSFSWQTLSLLPTIVLQTITAFRSIRFWRQELTPAPGAE